ncbi:MAG: very short patch repair endonuclease [Fimbriimonadaceae bacterium]|nr:very short patch repair endonuclease [Fimbriimonadaceae bacterium]
MRRSDTTPELQLRKALHAAGYRYRKDFPIRIGKFVVRPDIVFTRLHLAIFVDGCFWHCCPEHGQIPATNVQFWTKKLNENAARDRRQDQLLIDAGWVVLRIWEHEPLAAATAEVTTALGLLTVPARSRES